MKRNRFLGKKLLGASVALALIGSVVGCTPGGEPSDTPSASIQPGGTLRIGIPGEPGVLDPTMAFTLASISIFGGMCESLYAFYEDGAPTPQLAAGEAEFNESGDVARIPLREGVVFADGTPMDADAVKKSLERHMTHETSQRRTEVRAFESVSVVDEHTIEIQLTGPTAPGAFYGAFADRAGMIMSPTALDELGDEGFAASPVCVGPFKFDTRVAQDSVTLVKDENYYDADKVHLDKVVYQVMADSNVRVANIRSGDIHVMERVAPIDVATLEADSAIDVVKYEGFGFYNLIVNIGNVDGVLAEPGQVEGPMAEDARVRQAFEMSIDRDAINKAVYFGEFSAACGFMPPGSPLATPEMLECAEYDPAAAKALLESTGYDLPIPVEISVNQQPELRRIVEMVQAMVADTGFEVTIDIGESTAVVERGHEGAFDLYFNSWSGTVDPALTVGNFFGSMSPRAVGKYSNAEVDALIEEAWATLDADERAEKYAQIDRHLRADVPTIFLIRPVNLSAVRTNVEGIRFRDGLLPIPTYAGFTS